MVVDKLAIGGIDDKGMALSKGQFQTLQSLALPCLAIGLLSGPEQHKILDNAKLNNTKSDCHCTYQHLMLTMEHTKQYPGITSENTEK